MNASFDPLKDAIERIEAARFCRDSGDPNWAFGLTLAISVLAYCIKEHWNWGDAPGLHARSPQATETD